MLVKRSLFITAAAAIALVAFSSTADAAPGDIIRCVACPNGDCSKQSYKTHCPSGLCCKGQCGKPCPGLNRRGERIQANDYERDMEESEGQILDARGPPVSPSKWCLAWVEGQDGAGQMGDSCDSTDPHNPIIKSYD